jgi:hypothetical protein
VRYLIYKSLKRIAFNVRPALMVLMGAAALAGVAFVYTVNQFYNTNQVGTGRHVNISFLPEELASSIGIVLATLFVTMFTTLFASRGDFLRGIGVLFAEGSLTLALVGTAYILPGFAGETAYLQDYYTFVMKQVLVVAITMFPLMLVGGVTGMILYDKIGDTEETWVGRWKRRRKQMLSMPQKSNFERKA